MSEQHKTTFGSQVIERVFVDGSTLVGMSLINILIARSLGASGKGAIALAMLIANIIFVFSSFGVHQANNYFRGRRNHSPSALYTNAIIFSILISLVAGGIFLLVYPMLADRFFSGLPVRFILLALTILPFLHIQSSFTNFLLIEKKLRYYNAVSILKVVVQVVLVYVFLFPLQLGTYSVVAAWIVAQAFLGILTVYKTWRAQDAKLLFHFALLKETFLFGLRGYFGNFIYFINQRLDLIMVSFFLPLADVGVYSVASALSEILLQLPGSVTTILFPRVAATTDEDSNQFTPRIFRNMIVIMILLGLGLAVFGHLVISFFFGPEFERGITPLYVMIPGVAFIGAATVLGNDLSARGRLEVHSYIAGIGLVLDVVLNILLIPHFGLLGAALGSTLSYTLIALALIVAFRVITKVSFRDMLILKKSDLVYYARLLHKLHLLPESVVQKLT